jgi:hypothetical protein
MDSPAKVILFTKVQIIYGNTMILPKLLIFLRHPYRTIAKAAV